MQCCRGRQAAAHGHRDSIEVAGAHFPLVTSSGIAFGFAAELGLLKAGVRGHPTTLVGVRQFEHAVVQRVETGQCDELKPVPHVRELALK